MVAQVSRSTRKPNTRKATPGTKRKLAAAMENTAKAEITQEKKAALLGERKEEFIKIAKLKTDVALQPRAKIDQETIDDYVEKMQSGIKFPPVIIFYDGQNHFLADGYHRREAHEVLGKEEILSEIIPGTLDDAKWYSYAVNASHGLPRSTEDKRRAIRAALSHPNSAKMNDSELGRYLKVSSNTVKKYREELAKEITPETETETEAPTTETKRLVTRKSPSGKISTFEQTVNSSARSKAQKEKAKPQQEFHNKYEFWEQNGQWEIPIPDDLLSSNIGVTFSVEEKGYRFLFVDKKKALLNEEYTQVISRDEPKETATPFLYAQGRVKQWVDEKAEFQKRLFEAKDAGFAQGVRVSHNQYGEGIVKGINQLGLINVFYDNNFSATSKPSELTIIPVTVWSVGDVVKISPKYKRTNWEWWCAQTKVQVTQKHDNNLYEVKDFHRAEGKRKSLIFHWWEIEALSPIIEAKIEATPSESPSEVTEKNIDTIDYYLIAIGCLPNLSDNDLLQLKSAIDREIKLRNIEVVDDLKGFQQALVKYAASQGKSSPEGWAHTVIKNHKNGEVSPLWDDFLKGVPLGSSSQVKRDWEVEPGMPYTAFKEERIQYWIAKGEPIESASLKAGNELRNPTLAKDLWEGFLRKSDRIANEALKAKEMGVTAYLPPSFNVQETITKESVMVKIEQLSEQHSLPESQPEVEEELRKPTIEELQKGLSFPASAGLTRRRINDNPQWGYQVIDGKVVEESSSSSDEDDTFIELAKEKIPNLIAVIKDHSQNYIAISQLKSEYTMARYCDGSYRFKALSFSKEEIANYYANVWSNPEIIFGSLEV